MPNVKIAQPFFAQTRGSPWPARPRRFLLLPLALVACSSDEPPSGGTCDVQAAFAAEGCTSCHASPGPAAGIDFTLAPSVLGPSLVDRASAGCSGQRIIDSRVPANSVLLSSVDHARRLEPGACALAMPPGKTADGFSSANLTCLDSWIKELTDGAHHEPFQPVSIATALAKLKVLVHGGAVTEAELAAVQGDPNQLPILLDGWTHTPEFVIKLRSFLGTALQQDSVGAMKETLGFPISHFEPSELLRNKLAASFVNTATDIVTTEAPFTEVVTSHKRSLTTAELVLLAYSDQTTDQIDNTTYKIRLVGPPKAGDTPATLRKNGDVWELGGALEAGKICRINGPDTGDIPDPQIMSSERFLAMLFGRVQCRRVGDARFVGPVTTADHNDARQVSIETTTGTSAKFFEIAALRRLNAGEIFRLRTARPGFFNSSVFRDNWPTNVDNDFRVTLNQTLMVALGATFSPGDATVGATTGIDEAHADPTSTCYHCHRLMDPMRPFFANSIDTFYRAATTPPVGATFAFLQSTRTGTSVDDFALALVEHPRFAIAWVLRICSWANSRACSAAEPEVVALANGFRQNWNFRKLIVDTLSSPLVTGLSGTSLSEAPTISITRRRHLCSVLRVRLGGLVDSSNICTDTTTDLSRGIADDAFARNQPEFVQTSQPGTFFAAGTERICEKLATRAVNVHFPADDVPGSTSKLAEQLMGLPPSHPRHNTAITELTNHVASVVAAGGTAAQAMQSAFVVACTSPDVTGVGL